jgi:hypothetical protein
MDVDALLLMTIEVTYDDRILKKRLELKAVLGQTPCIVNLEGFLAAYDRFKDAPTYLGVV